MNRQQTLEYYSNDFVSRQILAYARQREVAGAFWDGTYDKRPNILQFQNDVIQMAAKGVTSFHLSVEHWKNAMAVTSENTQNYDSLRAGWDIILDIDSKLGIEESQLAGRLICKVLEKYGIKNYGIKFSGRRGFHVSMPWIMFPKIVDYKNAETMYPLVPRIISRFIRKKISKKLMRLLVKRKGAKQLMEMIGDTPPSPYFFVDVEKNWGNRHMFRAPFSLNEKTWLASVPISPSQFKAFSKDIAEPKYVVAHTNIYDSFFKGEENEAEDLMINALDWYASIKKDKPPEKKRQIIKWESRIWDEYFPPCIKNILMGMQDGRKRSVFTLVNFLRMMNWDWPEIESKIFEWNEKNRPPLPRSIILGHLRYSQKSPKQYTPTNCPPDGDLFYGDTVNVCRPDTICTQGTNKIMIRNPVVYPFRILKMQRKKEDNKKKTQKRWYSCGVCNEQLKSMRALTIHKSRKHDIVED